MKSIHRDEAGNVAKSQSPKRFTRIAVLVVIILAAAAVAFYFITRTDTAIPPLAKAQQQELAEFRGLPTASTLKIAMDDEPGERLLLCLRFIDNATQRPLADQDVQFYHASLAGEYEPTNPEDESTARLSGLARTDPAGRIFVETILPGDYGSSDDNRHIHTTVFGARPEAYDIHFSQHSTFMLRNFVAGSDQHFLAFLERAASGELVCFVTIEAKLPQR